MWLGFIQADKYSNHLKVNIQGRIKSTGKYL